MLLLWDNTVPASMFFMMMAMNEFRLKMHSTPEVAEAGQQEEGRDAWSSCQAASKSTTRQPGSAILRSLLWLPGKCTHSCRVPSTKSVKTQCCWPPAACATHTKLCDSADATQPAVLTEEACHRKVPQQRYLGSFNNQPRHLGPLWRLAGRLLPLSTMHLQDEYMHHMWSCVTHIDQADRATCHTCIGKLNQHCTPVGLAFAVARPTSTSEQLTATTTPTHLQVQRRSFLRLQKPGCEWAIRDHSLRDSTE